MDWDLKRSHRLQNLSPVSNSFLCFIFFLPLPLPNFSSGMWRLHLRELEGNAFSSSCYIWRLLCVLCWLMASSTAMGASCGPWVLIQSPGSVNLVFLLLLISKVFQVPLTRMVTPGVQDTYAIGLGSPACPGSAGSLQEDGHLTFLYPTPRFRTIRLKEIISILKSRCLFSIWVRGSMV